MNTPKPQLNLLIAFAAERQSTHFGSIKTPFGEATLTAQRYPYVGAPLALQAWFKEEGSPMWEPLATVTKAYTRDFVASGVDLDQDEILVKTYDVNEPLRAPLLACGLFKDSGKRIKTEYVELEVWRITEQFCTEFAAKHPTFDLQRALA